MNAKRKISYDTTYSGQLAWHIYVQALGHAVLAAVFSDKSSMSDDNKIAIHLVCLLIIFPLVAHGMSKQGMINGGTL